jgi:hypothetical protein
MHDDHESDIGRYSISGAEKPAKRLKRAGRGADRHDT